MITIRTNFAPRDDAVTATIVNVAPCTPMYSGSLCPLARIQSSSVVKLTKPLNIL